MEQISERGSFSILRSRAMRNGALAVCAYMFVMALNAVLEPVTVRDGYLMLFPPNVFPWMPATVVLALNLAFYAYLVWFFIALICASQCLEERLIIAAFGSSFGIGFLGNLASTTATAFVRYADLAIWSIATAAAARMVVARQRDTDAEDVDAPAVERTFVTTALLFVGETLVSTAGAMLVVAIALRLFYPTVHVILPDMAKESFTALNFLPYFPLQVAAAFALGFFTALHFNSRTAMFVWIVPLAITILYTCTYQPASVLQNKWAAVLSRLFGTSCRPPDCYDQVILIAPLYAALAFSCASWLRLKKERLL